MRVNGLAWACLAAVAVAAAAWLPVADAQATSCTEAGVMVNFGSGTQTLQTDYPAAGGECARRRTYRRRQRRSRRGVGSGCITRA